MPHPPDLPPPPDDARALLAWAEEHAVLDRLDDVIIGHDEAAPPGTFLPGRPGEVLTYRDILLAPGPHRHPDHAAAAKYLHRLAGLCAEARARRIFLTGRGRDPEDAALAALLARLETERDELLRETTPRPDGAYEPAGVRVAESPLPMLQYEEWPLVGARTPGPLGPESDALVLLGWNQGPLRWVRCRQERLLPGEIPPARRLAATTAIREFLRDPRPAGQHELLGELLRLPPWKFALGTLDAQLAAIPGPPVASDERIAYRVRVLEDGFDVEPMVQRRARGAGFSKGARLAWHHLPARPDLTPADRRAYQAYDDRFARSSELQGGALRVAQVFGILRALTDHPAVSLEGERDPTVRLDLRQGRLRLRFGLARDGSLTPQFELCGQLLLPEAVAQALRGDRFVMHLHRPDRAPPQLLLAEVSAQAAAVVRALALAGAHFPPDAHDALAARLEGLQETVDIEFPSSWTRTITPADDRIVVRLELVASGALLVELGVRPVLRGPVFAPGEGPALVLEGQGRDRHGARRDRAGERQNGHALAERLGLEGGAAVEPWRWRVGEGDPALDLVANLKDLGGEVVVEWADDERLIALGSVGRGDLRLRVGDQRDWFAIDGGAQVAGEVVPLYTLLAAIREDRRYVRVGRGGFVRLEESLRAALARAAGTLVERRERIEVPRVATDALVGLVEEEAQIEASAAFRAVRAGMKAGDEVTPRLPDALAAALRPYQRAGVTWMARLAHWGAGAILADEMGLGKTIQTLALLAHRAEHGPALVVAPTSVGPNWLAEAQRFVPALATRLYRGGNRAALLTALGPGDLVVTSYAIAALDAEALARIPFGTLVLDEAQAVKNASTERARALRAIDAGWRLALTGTPIENHLADLWSILRVISPGLLGSWEHFRGTYAIPIEKFGDEARAETLAGLLRPFLLRRTKAEVARELPPRTEIVRKLRLSPEELALYHELRQSTLDEIARKKQDPTSDTSDTRFLLLASLTRLRQLCCHPRLCYPRAHAGSSKAAELLDLLAELREGGHKVLVFSQWKSFLDLLAPRLAQAGVRALVLDGTTPAELRERRIASFQAGEADVFLISLKAGGVGLNLTAADTVIHLDPWWNPAVIDQATARAHRIGQDKPVTEIRLVAAGTIEEAVLELHESKRALAAGILAGADLAAALSTEELVGLIAASPADEL